VLVTLALKINSLVGIERAPGSLALVAGVLGQRTPVSSETGTFLVKLFTGNQLAMFLAPCGIGGFFILLFAVTLKDRRLAEKDKPTWSLREFANTFYINPRRNPDFAWAFASRFMFVLAYAFLVTYQAYYLLEKIGSAKAEVPQQIFLGTLVQSAVVVAASHIQVLRLVEQVECATQISFSLPYPRHRDPPAIPVLRQPGVLAQLLAAQQLLGGGGQVVALAVDLAHPHVHVCRSAQNRPALLGRRLQGLLVGAHGLAETALGTPDVRQRDRAPEGIGDVPGPSQSRHALGIPRVPGLEVPARPGREPHECRCRSTAEVVISRRKLERPPGVPHGAGPIAPSQGLGGTVQLDLRRESAKFRVVDDDHLRRWGRGSLTDTRRPVQPPLGAPLAWPYRRPGR
jgi:hypothetical protein